MFSDLFLLETSTCTHWMLEIMARGGRRVNKNAQDRYMPFTPPGVGPRRAVQSDRK
jgi:hypothetical protein